VIGRVGLAATLISCAHPATPVAPAAGAAGSPRIGDAWAPMFEFRFTRR
jgi:hypothetical protein